MAHRVLIAHISGNATRREIVAYCRVSAHEQHAHGLGLEAQLATIHAFARLVNGQIVAEYQEAVTGRRDHLRNRPELVKALAHAKRSQALLVFARWDRLSRNVSVTSQLLESSVDFVACDNPDANRLTIHILAATAEYESQLRSERLKKEVDNIAPYFHNRPQSKAAYVTLSPIVCRMYATNKSTRYIADWLNKREYKTMHWNLWTIDAVVALLRLNTQVIRPRDPEEKRRALKRAWKASLRARETSSQHSFQRAHPIARKLRDRSLTLQQIAEILNQGNIPTPSHKSWLPVSVAALLRWAN